MTNYNIVLQRFNTEFRNGSTFATNPTTDFSLDLKANSGELCKLTQTIEISVTVNPDEIQTITYNATTDPTYGEFVGTGIDFRNEGFYSGAVIDVTWDGNAPVSTTIGLIVGPFYSKIKVLKSALITAGIVDGDVRTDFKIRLTSVPDTLIYKYGLNPNDYSGTNYTSWFDSNVQGYYLFNLTTSLQTMTRIGPTIKSWDLSTVQAKFDSTSGTYFHQYTIEHIFRVPYYLDGQYENLNDGNNPPNFVGTASIRYDSGWFFGGTTFAEYIKAEIQGGPGNVGYFRESYNGQANHYEIQNVAIANSDNSGVLEGSVVNTLTFQIKKNSAGDFTSSSKVILYHSKLPTQTEYQNKTDIYDTVWIFESLVTTAGASAVSGTIITNFDVTVNADPTILDVTADIQYTSDQQALITNASNYLLWVSVGNLGAMDPDERVALPVDLNQWSKNLDVPDLVLSSDVRFYEPFEYDSGVRDISTWTGFNGDIGGCELEIVKITTPALSKLNPVISDVRFKIISTNGTETFELLSVSIPIGTIQTMVVFGETFQVLDVDDVGYLNVPQNLLIGRVQGEAQGYVTPGEQLFKFRVGFQTPWRDWVFNNNVPMDLYDISIPNNNQNYKTSNYSNVAGYEVFFVWDVKIITSGSVETIYRKMTAESNITDFDTAGSSGFSGEVKYYDETGEISNIYNDKDVTIVISFPHSLGTINKSNIEGYIWIERNNSTSDPFYLHTSIDTNMPDSPLYPSDTLGFGNVTFVEVISSSNVVRLICKTNKDNIQEGVSYNVYGRIKNKTAL